MFKITKCQQLNIIITRFETAPMCKSISLSVAVQNHKPQASLSEVMKEMGSFGLLAATWFLIAFSFNVLPGIQKPIQLWQAEQLESLLRGGEKKVRFSDVWTDCFFARVFVRPV